MISTTFIKRPQLAAVIAIVITIAGAIALTRIPVAQFPECDDTKSHPLFTP